MNSKLTLIVLLCIIALTLATYHRGYSRHGKRGYGYGRGYGGKGYGKYGGYHKSYRGYGWGHGLHGGYRLTHHKIYKPHYAHYPVVKHVEVVPVVKHVEVVPVVKHVEVVKHVPVVHKVVVPVHVGHGYGHGYKKYHG